MEVKVDIEITPGMLAEAFASMGSDDQAEFFAQAWRHMTSESEGGDWAGHGQCLWIREEIAKNKDAQAFLEELREPETVYMNGDTILRAGTHDVDRLKRALEVPADFAQSVDMTGTMTFTPEETNATLDNDSLAKVRDIMMTQPNPMDYWQKLYQQPGKHAFAQECRGWDLADSSPIEDIRKAKDEIYAATVNKDYSLLEMRTIAAQQLGDDCIQLRDPNSGRAYFASSTAPGAIVQRYRKMGGKQETVTLGRIQSCDEGSAAVGKWGCTTPVYLSRVSTYDPRQLCYHPEKTMGVASAEEEEEMKRLDEAGFISHRVFPKFKVGERKDVTYRCDPATGSSEYVSGSPNPDCPDCNGTGEIELLNSFVECERCNA